MKLYEFVLEQVREDATKINCRLEEIAKEKIIDIMELKELEGDLENAIVIELEVLKKAEKFCVDNNLDFDEVATITEDFLNLVWCSDFEKFEF